MHRVTKDHSQGDTAVEEKDEVRVKKPRLYRVIFLNDDYTTMEFVVAALEVVFRKSPAEASAIMLNIHNTGSGIVGVYTREIAETRAEKTLTWARQEGHPLMVTIEPA